MKKHFPNNRNVIRLINELREYLYPDHFQDWRSRHPDFLEFVESLKTRLQNEIYIALNDNETKSKELITDFFKQLPFIKEMLDKDGQAGYMGDPAAVSIDEIILTYPGFFAVFVHRIAHYLQEKQVPLIPRMMSEYAHSKTGIDIHPGATIGEYFFIDHGTGVVIGETTVVGDNVKIYQGVTLGALSTLGGQKLAGVRRHPKIEDNVTIYAGTTILGGETVIGHDSIIGGNAFIIDSIAANTKIRNK